MRNRNGSVRRYEDGYDPRRSSSRDEREPSASASRTPKKCSTDDLNSASDEGLRDEEIEEFLHSRSLLSIQLSLQFSLFSCSFI